MSRDNLQAPSIKKLYPGDIKDVPASGPAPVLMRFEDFMRVVPTYVNVSVLGIKLMV